MINRKQFELISQEEHSALTDPNSLINYDNIIELGKVEGMNITWRKLNYYKTLGLLPKSQRVPGDKRGYYPASVFQDLRVYNFLQNSLGFTLDEIKEIVDRFQKWKLRSELKQIYGNTIITAYVEKAYTDYLRQAYDVVGFIVQDNAILGLSVINGYFKDSLSSFGFDYLEDSLKEGIKTKLRMPQEIAKEWAIQCVNDLRKDLEGVEK